MIKIRNMKIQDVEKVAWMVFLDRNEDPERGCKEAKEHTSDHSKIGPQDCYIVENEENQIIATMILNP